MSLNKFVEKHCKNIVKISGRNVYKLSTIFKELKHTIAVNNNIPDIKYFFIYSHINKHYYGG